MKKIIVDVMKKDGLFYDTMKIEPQINMICDYYGNTPVVSVTALCKTIEERRPTLKGTGYTIYSCNKNYLLNYDLN